MAQHTNPLSISPPINESLSCLQNQGLAERLSSRRQIRQVEVGDGTEEGWSYPHMALRDPVKNLVRIYGQYSVKVIG